MDTTLTFEKLPEAVSLLTKEVIELKIFLLEKANEKNISHAVEEDKLLTIQEEADLLHLKVPTLYSKVCKGELPVMKRGKRLYFSKQELLNFLKEGARKPLSQITSEAETYLNKKGGKNG